MTISEGNGGHHTTKISITFFAGNEVLNIAFMFQYFFVVTEFFVTFSKISGFLKYFI